MKFLILGMIIGLSGIGMSKFGYDILGMLALVAGLFLIFKGRDELKNIFPD